MPGVSTNFNKTNTMKCLLLNFIIIFLLAGCMGTKKYSRFVNQELSSNSNHNKDSSNIFIFKTDSLPKHDSNVTSKKIKSLFIPAILYWQWENTICCEFNSSVPTNILTSTITSYSDSIKLGDRLNGQKIELSIDRIPSTFIYTYKGYTIIFLVAYMIREIEAIYPQEEILKVRYRIMDGNKELKNGTIAINNKDKPIKNVWKSTKKFTWYYIDRYNYNIKCLSKELIDRLLIEI